MSAEARSNPGYSPGDIIGDKYRLVQPLGEGGMGSVWVAENTVLEVDVAIKLIRRDIGAPSADQRFLREARAAARLGHPSIVRIFDYGTTPGGDPYIVMELLRGESLAARMAREVRLSAVEAVRLLLPVIDALGAAHAKGIVHRDLKPENIFLSQDESGRIEPKVVDFGIAKLEERLPAPRLTQAGTLLGSPEYMSSEQAAGLDDIDARSDVWSVCVVLYEAICGAVPFDGANYNAVLRAILNDEPRSIVEFAAGDSRLWEILRSGLAKDRARRCASIRELGGALAQWLFDNGVNVDIRNSSVRASWIDLEREVQRITISSLPPASGERPSQGRLSNASPLPNLDAVVGVQGPNTLEPRVLQRSASVPAPKKSWYKRRAVVLPAAALAGLSMVVAVRLVLSSRSHAPVAPETSAHVVAPEPASAPAPNVPLAPALPAAALPEASPVPSASSKTRHQRASRPGREPRAKPAAKPKPEAATTKPPAPATPQQKPARREEDFGF